MRKESFAVVDDEGNMFFVEAHRVTVDRDGRLVFRHWTGLVEAAVNADQWARVRRGLTYEDARAEKGEHGDNR